MALNLVKISGYRGIFFSNNFGIIPKNVDIVELQKLIKQRDLDNITIYQRMRIENKIKHIPFIYDNDTNIKRFIEDKIINQKPNTKANIVKNKLPKILTLDYLFDSYKEHIKPKLKENSTHLKNISSFYNLHIKPNIGTKNVKNIRIDDIQTIANNLSQRLKPRTVKKIKEILNPIFKIAIKKGLIETNIIDDLILAKFDNKKYFNLSLAKSQTLYKTIQHQDPFYKAMFLFFLCGRRKNEVLSLKWEWISFENMTYIIPHNVNGNKANKNLQYPLTKEIMEALNDIGVQKEGLIFKSPKTKKQIVNISSKTKSIFKISNIDNMTIHDFRHLHGYIKVNYKEDLKAISKSLGHSNTNITERYSNISLERMRIDLMDFFNMLDNKSN